ncbi:MAG: Alanine--tRNA ligase [Verrucomicrobia bacterium ADurb.Bin345]|nr:MAG: Alanine--tRNA ligase [Verrucomicrobia bacterium ADurb.Bin345]
MMTASEIRQSFLDFFRARGHEIVPSSPVVLPSDPTLLFANAGMNQFKEIFLGSRESAYRRVADTQKCIRVSGKHNDLEEVGHDTYHHTFFEMLGNWSFGDYYKREAITWAWELLTEVWKLPKDRLWATVYKNDDEAERLWKEITDINPAHVLRFGEKDNFWEMGETGPCGPCSEIHIDRTAAGCTPDQVNAGTPDVIELWNLVFIQYNRRGDGSLEELPNKHVDTGMGFERIVSVLQGKPSNYDTDVFVPLLEALQKMSGMEYEGDAAVAMRVVADHVRTLSFAIADGVLPSNEGRGYVLRRLLRRAVRYGRKIGLTRPFIHELVPVLEKVMGRAFPEIGKHRSEIVRAIRAEEESFAQTLDRGISLFEETVEALASRNEARFPGEEAFKLYDTYGFPIDLTVLMASEKGLTVDQKRFAELMEGQRERARGARKDAAHARESDIVSGLIARGMKTGFTGYETLEDKGSVLLLLSEEGEKDALGEGDAGEVMLDKTPFYAESGGQIGDKGMLRGPAGEFEVWDTQRPAEGLVLHIGKVVKGRLSKGDAVTAIVDAERRARTARHHTGTHLLQFALREVVSPTIKQAGSYVAPERLRFDFSYFEAVSPELLERVERRANELVVANLPVSTYSMPLKDVQGSGIIAMFDEKYGDVVRVVDVKGHSRELCGGTHVHATGDIGLFKIVSESSVAAGVRRIEAVCGIPAYERMRHEHDLLRKLAHRLSAAPEEVYDRLETLMECNRKLEKTLKQQATQSAMGQVDALLAQAVDVGGVKLVAADVGEHELEVIRNMTDALRDKLGPGVIVLGGHSAGKASFVANVSEDWVKKGVHAGKLIGQVAKLAGGGGGGQPQRAQAGGKDPSKVGDAIRKVPEIVSGMLA